MKNIDKTEKTAALKAKALTNTFANQEGRRPRILLSKLAENNHEHDTKFIASAYADMGFDVDLGPSFQSAKDISKQAIENDVHALHLSSVTHETINIIPEIIASLLSYGSDYMLLIVDGDHLSDQDCNSLLDSGVHLIIKPGILLNDVAIQILNLLIE